MSVCEGCGAVLPVVPDGTAASASPGEPKQYKTGKFAIVWLIFCGFGMVVMIPSAEGVAFYASMFLAGLVMVRRKKHIAKGRRSALAHTKGYEIGWSLFCLSIVTLFAASGEFEGLGLFFAMGAATLIPGFVRKRRAVKRDREAEDT